MPTLVLVRHAKSDWSPDVPDVDRGLAPRGERQAPHVGTWLVAHELVPDLVLVSPARRAQDTWRLIGPALGAAPQQRRPREAYTFDGDDLLALVRDLPPAVQRAALVGHNPALEELVESLTGEVVTLKTSTLAVVDVGSWRACGDGSARLRAWGRPADDDGVREA